MIPIGLLPTKKEEKRGADGPKLASISLIDGWPPQLSQSQALEPRAT